jgi:hypothetical protein
MIRNSYFEFLEKVLTSLTTSLLLESKAMQHADRPAVMPSTLAENRTGVFVPEISSDSKPNSTFFIKTTSNNGGVGIFASIKSIYYASDLSSLRIMFRRSDPGSNRYQKKIWKFSVKLGSPLKSTAPISLGFNVKRVSIQKEGRIRMCTRDRPPSPNLSLTMDSGLK